MKRTHNRQKVALLPIKKDTYLLISKCNRLFRQLYAGHGINLTITRYQHLSVAETHTAARSKTALLTGLLLMAIYTPFRAAIRRQKTQRAAVLGSDSPLKDEMLILHPGQDALLDRCSGCCGSCTLRQSRSRGTMRCSRRTA